MTRIERRQARLSQIRAQTLEPSKGDHHMGGASNRLAPTEAGVEARYIMASNQNQPVDLGSAVVNCFGAIHHDLYLVVSFPSFASFLKLKVGTFRTSSRN